MNQLRKLLIRQQHCINFTQRKISFNQLRLSQNFFKIQTFNFSQAQKTHHFKEQTDTESIEDSEIASTEVEEVESPVIQQPIKKVKLTDLNQEMKIQVIKIPALNTNTYELGQLFNVEPVEILNQIQRVSKEMITDEFQDLPPKIIETLALHYGKEIELFYDPDVQKNYKMRPPVVTIMGHVDHGKTTLLDAFRHSQKVKEEYGDITQSIGAFTFVTDSQHEITFIDTPGHEAFQNLRVRGAKVTDMIILVISAIESVQPQTIEVIKLAQNLSIPLIVAINKIDREAADPEAVLFDLATHNLIPEDLGGDVFCVPISAKQKINLDLLEQKIIDVAQEQLNLVEDFNCKAQCFIIESNFDEKTTQITATVLVKKGMLRQDDIFVCGINEGRVRFMKNDQGKNVKSAYPGQAIHLGGFRAFPEVGSRLYACETHEKAVFISSRIKSRREKELSQNIVDQHQPAQELKKKLKGMTRIEKRKLYGGDRTIMYEKMGLLEESDVEKYRKKLGIKKDVNILGKDEDEVADIIEEASSQQLGEGSKKKSLSFKGKRNLNFNKEEFKKIVKEYQEEQNKKESMTNEELAHYEQERMKLKELYRGEDIKHFPLVIKASSAGVLETLLKEAEKVVGSNNYRISIIDYSVGPVTEGDMSQAQQTGAVIFAFDVPCSPIVNKTAENQGVVIKQHKIIYKFLEDIENFVFDANTVIQEESGKALQVEVIGSASVSQIFKIKDQKSKNNKMISVVGCKVSGGDIERKFKYRVVRNGRVLQDNLKLHSMKKLQQDVTTVEKGHECGLSFENFDGELKAGDIIEAYKEVEGKIVKFNHKPGVHQSY